jgi:Tfp pilus assembly protein PilF
MRQAGILVGLAIAACAASSASGQMGGYGAGGFNSMSVQSKPNYYDMAQRLIRRQRYADAIPYLDRALAARPHSADILDDLAYAHRMVGDYSGSLAWYQKALAEDSDRKDARENLGELYLNMHDVASARAQLAELARLCPTDCEEHVTLAKSIDAYVAVNPPIQGAAATPGAATPTATTPAAQQGPANPTPSPPGKN